MFSLVKSWHPWDNFLDTARGRQGFTKVDEMFDDFTRSIGLIRSDPIVREHDNHYSIEIEVPGFEASEIEITLNNQVITTKGSQNRDQKKKKFQYSWYLPSECLEADITSELEKGILTIKIPKSAPVKVPIKSIEVRNKGQ